MTLKRTGQSAAVMCSGPVENIGMRLGFVPVASILIAEDIWLVNLKNAS